MSRALELSDSATWWPSVLWQTTTLELRRDGVRLLVDPGIAPWEVQEAAGDGVAHILITHGDWDHVMGIGLLPDARVWLTQSAAERIDSGEAAASVRKETQPYGVPVEGLEGLRWDEQLPLPGELSIGPWAAACRSSPGHTPDGVTTWLPEEGLLLVGDYLGEHEIPFIYDSAWNYRATLEMLTELISRERPRQVVVGHGRPHSADRALEIAEQDHAYVESLIEFVTGGGTAERAEEVAYPDRGGSDDAGEHRNNVELAARAVA